MNPYKLLLCLTAITLISCNSSKTNNSNDSKNNLLAYYNYNIDSIAKATPISKSDFIKIEIGEIEINREGHDMIQEIIEADKREDISSIKSEYSLEEITTKAPNFSPIPKEIYSSEIEHNNSFQNHLYSSASKSLIKSAKSVIDEEFGIFRQFHHLWNALLVKCYIKDDSEITSEWNNIIRNKLDLQNLNVNINNRIRNYQNLVYNKHLYLDPKNATKYQELPMVKIDINKLDLMIEPYIQEKLSNEGYDIGIDIFFTILIVFITSLIYKPLIDNAIINANNWGKIRENLLNTGELLVQSKRKSKDNPWWMNLAMDAFKTANKGFTEYRIREAKAKFESERRLWRSITGSIITIASLCYFVPQDLKIEAQIQEELTQIFIKNIEVKNIDVLENLDNYTNHFFNV
ncbi:hypothetical protein K5X82_15450 [Halosquirtibacter xylanolyticus]|uniref:hypothetical protein n=1 Tax=Halosquirtibacter xylanolyticus TaxID=3374599 RepID=UPI003749A7D6|nr:hypothetical protein K5X82_15450 [Prolixibacteraceae bacterium]